MLHEGASKVSSQQRYRAVVGTQDSQLKSDVVLERLEYDPGALAAAIEPVTYGLGMAPATGRLIAGMIDGAVSNAETSACAPGRFG